VTFPTIPTTGNGRLLTAVTGTASTTHTFPNLTSLTKNAGDLLIAVVVQYQATTDNNAEFASWGASLNELLDDTDATQIAMGAGYKWSTGSETGTFTVTSDSSFRSVQILMSIAGAHPSLVPEFTAMAVGTTTAADPASLSPSWGAQDTLWIAVCGCGETGTGGSFTGIGAAPTNYTDMVEANAGGDVTGGVDGGVAFQQLNAASEDVGTWTVDLNTARNAALLIAVPPVAATNANAEINQAGTGTAYDATVTVTGEAVPPVVPIMAPMVSR
jgi:hypothetical protein